MNEALRRARKDKQLTQMEVATLIKVSPATISKWERGVEKPRKEVAERLCKVLGKSAEEVGL